RRAAGEREGAAGGPRLKELLTRSVVVPAWLPAAAAVVLAVLLARFGLERLRPAAPQSARLEEDRKQDRAEDRKAGPRAPAAPAEAKRDLGAAGIAPENEEQRLPERAS